MNEIEQKNGSEADVRVWRDVRGKLREAIAAQVVEQKQAKKQRGKTRELEMGPERELAHTAAQMRVSRLRAGLRLKLLAYAFHRGVAYRRLEARAKSRAHPLWIATMLSGLGPEVDHGAVEAWMDA